MVHGPVEDPRRQEASSTDQRDEFLDRRIGYKNFLYPHVEQTDDFAVRMVKESNAMPIIASILYERLDDTVIRGIGAAFSDFVAWVDATPDSDLDAQWVSEGLESLMLQSNGFSTAKNGAGALLCRYEGFLAVYSFQPIASITRVPDLAKVFEVPGGGPNVRPNCVIVSADREAWPVREEIGMYAMLHEVPVYDVTPDGPEFKGPLGYLDA